MKKVRHPMKTILFFDKLTVSTDMGFGLFD